MQVDFLATFLDEAADWLADWEHICLELSERTPEAEINRLFRSVHSLKGTAKSVGLDAFGDLVHEAESVIERLRDRTLVPNEPTRDALLSCQSFLAAWVSRLRVGQKDNPDSQAIRAALQSLTLQKSLEAVLTGFQQFEAEDAELSRTTEPGQAPSSQKGRKHTESLKIQTERIDALLQNIGELSIHLSVLQHQIRLSHEQTVPTHRALSLAIKTTRNLQDIALGLRMQTVQPLFQRLRRVALDTARAQGKRLEIDISGEEVELDKVIIDRIGEALVHLVRNCVDHGLESREQRLGAGKPEYGTLRVSAERDATDVKIRVWDDGPGINYEKVKALAIERGLMNSDEVPSDQEVVELIFTPGLSTADRVSDVSGRGVGMDVVKKVIESLAGHIEVESRRGSGTVFTICLPTSVSILDALIVEIGDTEYAVPVADLAEVLGLEELQVHHAAAGQSMVDLRGTPLRLLDTEAFLPQLQGKAEGLTPHFRPVLVPSIRGESLGFMVTAIKGQQQIVVRPLPRMFDRIGVFVGSTIFSTGQPGFILNLEALAQQARQTARTA